jgi:hypothetical protein
MNKSADRCDLYTVGDGSPGCRSAIKGAYQLLETVLKTKSSGVDMAVMLHFTAPCRLYILARVDPDLGALTKMTAWKAIMGDKPNIGATYERIASEELDPSALFGIAIQAPNRVVNMTYYDAAGYERILRAVESGGRPGRAAFDPAIN